MNAGLKIWFLLLFFLTTGTVHAQHARVDAGNPCKALLSADIWKPKVTLAERVTNGLFIQPSGLVLPNLPHLPPFCRVAVTFEMAPGSDINIELWLPEENWNGRLLGTENGGGAGVIQFGHLARGLLRGFATASLLSGYKSKRIIWLENLSKSLWEL